MACRYEHPVNASLGKHRLCKQSPVLWAAKLAATTFCDQHGNRLRQSMVPLWRGPSVVGERARILDVL